MRESPKTLYEDVIAFSDKDKRTPGGLLKQRSRRWQDEAIKAALKCQGHFKLGSDDCFSLIDSVSVQNTPEDLRRLKAYLRLPFPNCWIEIAQSTGRIGFVLEQNMDPWSISLYTFQQITSEKSALVPHAISVQVKISEETLDRGTYHVERGDWLDKKSDQLSITHLFSMCKLVLLMNCRSAPFIFATQESRDFFAAPPLVETNLTKLANYNRRGRYPTHEIKFDFSRYLGENEAHSSRDDGDRIVLRDDVLVRGHFKVRKTGLWFWSPHSRRQFGKPGETPQLTDERREFNDYAFARTRPASDLVLPDDPERIISQGVISGPKS